MLSNLGLMKPKVVAEVDADGHFNPFPAYSFTGSLRPVYPLSPRRAVPERIRKPDYHSNGIPVSEQVRMHWEISWNARRGLTAVGAEICRQE